MCEKGSCHQASADPKGEFGICQNGRLGQKKIGSKGSSCF